MLNQVRKGKEQETARLGEGGGGGGGREQAFYKKIFVCAVLWPKKLAWTVRWHFQTQIFHLNQPTRELISAQN